MEEKPTGQVLEATTDARLAVGISLERDGPPIAVEPVQEEDLDDLRSAMWLTHILRKGRADMPMDDLRVTSRPVRKPDGAEGECVGFELGMETPHGMERQQYGPYALDRVAKRSEGRLVAEGVLKVGQVYHYKTCTTQVETPAPPDDPCAGVTTVVKRVPLTYRSAPLAPLLAAATPVGGDPVDKDWYPVFFTSRALLEARRCSLAGVKGSSPVESGAALVGSLCACPETGEFYAVISEALELADAGGTVASLSYSGGTWLRIQNVIRARHAQDPTCCDRMLGQSHGHVFLPQCQDTTKSCPTCKERASCQLTSVFVSQNDLDWTRAVFCRQPWALCLIVGFTARNEVAQALFGLRNGRLQHRQYYLIDAATWEANRGTKE